MHMRQHTPSSEVTQVAHLKHEPFRLNTGVYSIGSLIPPRSRSSQLTLETTPRLLLEDVFLGGPTESETLLAVGAKVCPKQ